MYTSDIGHRKSVTSEPAGTSANWHWQVADVNVVKNSSVGTTTELSPPPRWLATIEPYSVVGGVSGHCFMKTAPHSFADQRQLSKCRVIWSRVNARWHRPPPPSPRVRFSTFHRPCCRDAPGAVLNQTVIMVWFSTGLLTVTAIIQSAIRTHVNVRHCRLTDAYNIWLFPTWQLAATTAATHVDARCHASTCVMVRYNCDKMTLKSNLVLICVARRPATRNSVHNVNATVLYRCACVWLERQCTSTRVNGLCCALTRVTRAVWMGPGRRQRTSTKTSFLVLKSSTAWRAANAARFPVLLR